MSNSLGRGGRRRRVLNEEIVAASGTHAVYRGAGDEKKAHTYGEAACSDNHARVSDFMPRRSGSIWIGWFLGFAAIAGLTALDYFQKTIATAAGLSAATALEMTADGSLASWFASLLFFAATLTCVQIYSLRRHKLADYRGRYRIWVWAAALCLLLSASSVANLHLVFSAAAANLTGWTALPDHAIWWLSVGGVIGGWIGLRVLSDLWESRLARASCLVACLLFAIALLSQFGVLEWQQIVEPRIANLVPPTAMLAALVCLLTALVSYARFVILDADGLITGRARSVTKLSRTKTQPAAESTAPKPSAAIVAPRKSSQPATAVGASTTTSWNSSSSAASSAKPTPAKIEWTDGSTPDRTYGDEVDDAPKKRKLSKSERKRLRKLKAQQRRAA